MTSPIASVECDRMPSSASVDSVPRRSSSSSATDTSAAMTNTPAVRLVPSRKESATPSSAECAIVSPK